MSWIVEAIIDTNVIILDLFTESEFHNEASKLMDSPEKWLIPPIVVHELIWFLRGHGLEDRIDYIMQYVNSDKAEILCEYGD
ncbi:PIN domain-containing protein [Vulcanisaeta sp. JCM 14467]|uniref:PIN domain-containing protein n=1 Tax=Vulcanisaeta sp. JCM 14467 TaxID=1295370 RepID=UPI0020925E37|nr:PIN domain-containing protein [Vulcanisaeta sp. JCM 14467]